MIRQAFFQGTFGIRFIKKTGFLFFFSACIFAYDPVTVVQYPLLGRPAIVLPGGTFTIECKAGTEVSGWTAVLSMPYKEVTLAVTPGGYSNGIRSLSAKVPADAPFELYDLRVRASGGTDDAVRRSVRVIHAYKTDFTFIHLPDCHLPSVAWIGFYDDPNTIPEFRQTLREIDILQPEFVLQTGDLVDNGQDESQYRLAQDLLAESGVPVFVTGGNHDLWYDGHSYWNRYFGNAMNYSFAYGPFRFLGLEMYDIPTKTCTPDQMKWLMNELDASVRAGEKSRILFTHYDESRQISGDFADRYWIDGMLYGHTHLSGEQRLGLRQALKLNTSYTMDDNGEYRLVQVRDGKITEYTVLKFRHLRADVSPANDGTARKITATITNDNPAGLPSTLVRLHVRRDAAPFTVSGGSVLQFIDYEPNQRVYYITMSVPGRGAAEVTVAGISSGAEPPRIVNYSPKYDTTITAGQVLQLNVQASGQVIQVLWKKDGVIIPNQNGPVYLYRPDVSFQGRVILQAEVSNPGGRDVRSWTVYVEKVSGKPELVSSTRNFFPYGQEAVIQWKEPVEGKGILEYGPVPGQIAGTFQEEANTNQVRFTPSKIGMGLGLYYGVVKSGGISSDEFPFVIESPQAPTMIGPVGDTGTLTPVFQWEPVQGVPYSLLILTDQEIVITENKDTGEYSLEGANPIWAALTSEHSVSYGAPDPSGTFTSFPAPLVPGGRYWWVVLNCYGSKAELASTVQSGVSAFRVSLPQTALKPPVLISPAQDAELSGPAIVFQWSAVAGASGYKFYPCKMEMEEGVEVVRPVWETVITTTNTVLEYDAARLFVKGRYQWKMAAVDKNGNEVPGEVRRFSYDAPAAVLDLRTFDGKGTEEAGDDLPLPRVHILYDALIGVDMGLPLSTDKQGERLGLLFAPGTYVFSVDKEGFAPFRDTLSLAEGQTLGRDIRLVPDPSTLSGKTIDQTNNPVAAALIRARHGLRADVIREAVSNQSGNFTLSISAGPWRVSASKPGYQNSSEVSVTIQSGAVQALSSSLVIRKNINSISGVVLNASGQPVYGAVVEISSGGDRVSSSTNADGRFGFSVPDGTWLFRVGKTGFTSPSAQWISVSGGRSLEVSPSPQLIPSGALAAGTVSDGLSAAAEALVRAVPSSGSVVLTFSDGYGNFVLTLSPGYYRLYAEKNGFGAGSFVEMSIAANEAVTGIPLFVRPNTAAVSGLVTLDGFTPLPGSTVFVNGKSVLTDAGGRYEIWVPPGQYRVTTSKAGYLSSGPIDLTAGFRQRAENIDFVLAPNASVIKGQVYSSSGGVSGARVESLHAETWTDENGNYSLNVDAGTHALTASKPGFQSKTIQVTAGQAQTLEGNHFALARNAGVLHGKITDKSSGAVLMGVRIDIPETGVSTVSKFNGDFQLELDPSEKGYTLRVSKEVHETRILSSGPVRPGGTVSLDVSLRLFSSLLSGRILDEKGNGAGSAVLTAAGNADSHSTVSEADGNYRLYLPSEGGSFPISVSKPGTIFPSGSVVATLSAGEKKTRDFFIQSRFVRLKGRVISTAEAFVTRASVKLKNAGGIAASVSSDESGNFDFVDAGGNPFLPEGTFDLLAGKPGYRDTSNTNLTLAGGSARTYDVMIQRHTGFLEGSVTDGTAPLADATIEAVLGVSGYRFTRITDDRGFFRLDRIPAGLYGVKLSKAGYTFLRDTTVVVPRTGLALVLSKNLGRFKGKVVDRETGQGIGSAGILAKDNHGNESRGTASGDGSYDMTLLPTLHPYTLQAYAGGFYSVTREAVSATRQDTVLFRLQRIYGSVAGKVILRKDSSAFPNALIRVAAGATLYFDTTDQDGRYFLGRLPTNLYMVTAEKTGHLAAPAYQSINLYGGGDKNAIDFELEKVTLASLNVSGPTSVESGRSGAYSYSAKTSDGRQMPIFPKWSVHPPVAADSLNARGVLYPKADFVGALKLFLADAHSGVADSMRVHVYCVIRPGDPERRLQDYAGGQFVLPAGCMGQPVSFGLKFPPVPDAKRLMSDYETKGPFYAFQPANLKLVKPMSLSFPVPESISSNAVLGKWNPDRLKWEIVAGVAVPGGLRIESDRLTQWTVMTPSLPLGIREFEAGPNPFSPFLKTLVLSFVPTSEVSSVVFTTIKIYNMNGDLVRDLVSEEGYAKGSRVEISWDGKTDSGSMALNGRYLIYFEAKDGSGTEKKLVTVVLIK